MSSIKAIRVSLLSQEKRSLGEKSRDNYSSDRMQVCQDWLPHSSRMNIRVIFLLFLKHCLQQETPSYEKYNRFFSLPLNLLRKRHSFSPISSTGVDQKTGDDEGLGYCEGSSCLLYFFDSRNDMSSSHVVSREYFNFPSFFCRFPKTHHLTLLLLREQRDHHSSSIIFSV